VSSTIIPKSAPCSGATCILAPRNALVSSLNALNTPHSRVFRSKYAYRSSLITSGAVFHGPVDDDDALDDDARARTGRRPAAAATTRARDARDGDARDDAGGDANERRVAARAARCIARVARVVIRARECADADATRAETPRRKRTDATAQRDRWRRTARAAAARRRRTRKKNDGRTIWSYRDECQTWRNYDASKGLRYTRDIDRCGAFEDVARAMVGTTRLTARERRR
jgi:hypothetical protein